jgi:hypothetical protein
VPTVGGMSTNAGAVPTGGTLGQVLAKNSAQSYDASWTTLSSGGAASASGAGVIPWTTGRTYMSNPVDTFSNSAYGFGPVLYPIRIPNACTVASLGLYINTANGGTTYVGLYADTGGLTTAGPGARLGYGSIDSSLGGWRFSTTMNTVFTGPTTVWMWFHGTVNNTGLSSTPGAGAVGNYVIDPSGAPSTTTVSTFFLVSGWTTSNPPPATAVGQSLVTNNSTSVCPHVFVKIA